MAKDIAGKILSHLKSSGYKPATAERVAEELDFADRSRTGAYRDALRQLMHEGRVLLGASNTLVLPGSHERKDVLVGIFRGNKRGFGFVVPQDPDAKADLYIDARDTGGALSGDTVRARILSSGHRDGKAVASGRVIEIIERASKRFVGELAKFQGRWVVHPDGNVLTEPIDVPDAASRYVRPGTRVVVELTEYPSPGKPGIGVISEVLGTLGEKDVDLKTIIVQHNLPGPFPDEVLAEARAAVDAFDPEEERSRRLDLTETVICTIDPDDAKDYDDAISLHKNADGTVELGVHIADVSHFVKSGGALDEEAKARGNSIYFPGHVIPMLPEILSNGVCSLQGGVPRLCKSAFMTYDAEARPIATRFANTVIKSSLRLRYREAQALIDAALAEDHKAEIPHPDGPKRLSDYPADVIELLLDMNSLSRRLQKRRAKQGQLVLHLPAIDLVLDEDGKVVDTRPEDESFTHTLIEMFMVEANEAVARLLAELQLPFLRRIHPEPELKDADKLKAFVSAAGHNMPGDVTRHELQRVLSAAKGKPEEYAVNLAVLKSLTRAEYSPKPDGHFALASDCYSHFTSPIRRYADLTVHRLLDAYFEAAGSNAPGHMAKPKGRVRVNADEQPSFDDLVTLGKHISFTERRAEGAERELRKLKILYLLESRLGEEFDGVVTGIANFGLYVQLNQYLVDGVCRFDDLMDDWWDIDERSGVVRGQRSGRRIGIGDAVKVKIARVVSARRELDLALVKVVGRIGRFAPTSGAAGGADQKGNKPQGRRALRDKTRQGKPIPKGKPFSGKPFPGKPFSQGKPFAGKPAAGKPWPGLEGNQAVGNAEGGGDGGEGVGFQLRRADGTTRRAKKSKLRDKKKINKPGRRQVIKKKKKK